MMGQRRTYRFGLWKLLLLLVLVAAGLVWRELTPDHPAPENLEGPYPVERVVDGDTIIVHIDGQRTRVRLIGVDAPESVAPEPERNTPEGEAASAFLKELLEGKSVYLEYDTERLDKYKRTLAYVYLEDGQTMVERLLLESGHGVPVKYGQNTRYYDDFCHIYNKVNPDPKRYPQIFA